MSRVGHGLARVLGIQLPDRALPRPATEGLSRGESIFSIESAESYVEEEPTAREWLAGMAPSRRDLLRYLAGLFPFAQWLPRYNTRWLAGDLVAGITVGAVVVPQSMAYAKLAELPVEFGLYSSFMGVAIYWFFATSKDITIGPVAVMSLVVGNVVADAATRIPDVPGHVVASALSVIAGAIVLALGLVRLGWLVDFISLTAICAFMTGSALNIAVGQVPTLLGLEGVATRQAMYRVAIDTLKNLGTARLDAAVGLTALVLLYAIRILASKAAASRPNHRQLFFFISTLRTAFVILLYTFIGWLVNRNRRGDSAFILLGTVPRGFQHAAVPTLTSSIVSTFAGRLPATVIVLLIEHISISKSFGRINNYTINPSQELVAIGVTNILGPFLGAYPATGSFSRTAIKSKAGVRTPFAGVVTAVLVVLALYALPAVFFYIPNASLAAVIIHAVGDLITPPNTIYQFWRISPLEVPIFFAGVLVTVFSSIENGVYTTICVSVALLLYRIFKARGRFLGRVKVHSVVGDHLLDGSEERKDYGAVNIPRKNSRRLTDGDHEAAREIFLPMDHQDGSNPQIEVEAPYPGVFIYRFSEGYNYPNANHYLDYMVDVILKETRRTNPASYAKPGDRPWNDPGPRRGESAEQAAAADPRPTLKAVILDFSSVNNVDVTSVQHLIDVRNQLDRYAAPDSVEWHFACVNNRWTKRALVAAGFGFPTPGANEPGQWHRWKPIFSVAELGGQDSAAAAAEYSLNERTRRRAAARRRDLEEGGGGGRALTQSKAYGLHQQRDYADAAAAVTANATGRHGGDGAQARAYRPPQQSLLQTRVAVVHGLNRPLFHMDLTSALQSAVASAERREAHEKEKGKAIEKGGVEEGEGGER
ncbi:sulfate transporter family-domain-containing protein [Lineolata rhizophorae]|uniref:Sulfate transporter family-domain-containing protein n=1 Tax=Lineolata rhizophorae TaxID=578093 RepID=A0A6A6P6Y3_9PEZI|nr:sulfate transporter family-domain-containing protein [Lineolata rhizophorae]